MNNEPCMVRQSVIDLMNLKSDDFHEYPFIISLDMSDGSCTTVKDLFGKTCVPQQN